MTNELIRSKTICPIFLAASKLTKKEKERVEAYAKELVTSHVVQAN